MTQSTEPASRRGGADVSTGTSMLRSAARRDQLVALVIALVLLVGAILLRPTLAEQKRSIIRTPGGVQAEASLKRLAIEFPRLTLGGFRGLLATVLWQRAEEAKNDRQWARLETQYDYIAVLQPYIVTVYVYHAWNQAYNLSAQWHELENKYKWVLDGLSYLYKGEEFNPGEADIQYEEANMYFLKLGGSFERIFYRKQWRTDLARLHEITGQENAPRTAALRLVKDFAARPEFKLELLPDPTRATTIKGFGVKLKNFPKDDDENSTLERPYGVSPFYFAYRAFQRTLANPNPPSTTGISVIDAWPAMSLRLWCRDDLYYGSERIRDFVLYEILQKTNRSSTLSNVLETAAATPEYKKMLLELRDCYENVEIVAPKAVDEFEKHLKRAEVRGWQSNKYIHRKHIKETEYYRALARADAAFLNAFDRLLQDKGKHTEAVKTAFETARAKYNDVRPVLREWINTLFPNNQPSADRGDYEKFDAGLQERMKGIAKILDAISGPTPNAPLDWDFLLAETVER